MSWSFRIYLPASLRSRQVWLLSVNTTMKALTPQPSASVACGAAEVSLLIAIELLDIPSPGTLLPFRSPRFETLPVSLPCEPPHSPADVTPPPGVGPRLGDRVRSGVRRMLASSPTGLAESSSLVLQTVLPPPVASHPFFRKRSYLRLQSGNDALVRTLT